LKATAPSIAFLLYFIKLYPDLKHSINKQAIEFCKSATNRIKSVVPSLGEFLPLLTVSDAVTWRHVCKPYLEENFDRNALWTIKKYPALANTSDNSLAALNDRLWKTWDATQVSMKLLMFHVYFFKNVARPEGLTLPEVAANYDTFYGVPSEQMKEVLQQKCKEILKAGSFTEFFEGIGVPRPNNTDLGNWLRQAVKNSAAKGYHTNIDNHYKNRKRY